jgi:hypothetical protein
MIATTITKNLDRFLKAKGGWNRWDLIRFTFGMHLDKRPFENAVSQPPFFSYSQWWNFWEWRPSARVERRRSAAKFAFALSSNHGLTWGFLLHPCLASPRAGSYCTQFLS